MKKVLLATSALVATAGFASAQGVAVTGSASMGVLGGDWVDNAAAGETEYELHTDIDVTFTMSGQTDTGLTFGANIDLDESDGSGSGSTSEGASPAFGNRTQGGEEIFISGGFGTLTMGDTDGAFDWALQEIGIGGSLGDVHTTHVGYNGNAQNDAANGGQIARYDYSFGDFAVGLSASISDDATEEDILAAGAKYNASLPAMELGFGIGYSQNSATGFEGDDAVGVSVDADFNNGFRAILNWAEHQFRISDDPTVVTEAALRGVEFDARYLGIGLGYSMEDWTIAANWGDWAFDAGSTELLDTNGYAFLVNYDLGGGAEIQLGYSKSEASTPATGFSGDANAFSLGVAMSF